MEHKYTYYRYIPGHRYEQPIVEYYRVIDNEYAEFYSLSSKFGFSSFDMWKLSILPLEYIVNGANYHEITEEEFKLEMLL